MRKLMIPILCMFLLLTGCESQEAGVTNNKKEEINGNISNVRVISEENGLEDKSILIVYFSRLGNTENEAEIDAGTSASVYQSDDGIQGNTEVVANNIHNLVGGDLVSINTEKKYPVEYSVILDEVSEEGERGDRPAVLVDIVDFDKYDVVFIGYPTWWYDMPMPVYNFIESYDFSGKTVVPFCTHGGAGFANSLEGLQNALGDVEVLEGIEIRQSQVSDSIEQIREWINALEIS